MAMLNNQSVIYLYTFQQINIDPSR
jgi:hypothetical protein